MFYQFSFLMNFFKGDLKKLFGLLVFKSAVTGDLDRSVLKLALNNKGLETLIGLPINMLVFLFLSLLLVWNRNGPIDRFVWQRLLERSAWVSRWWNYVYHAFVYELWYFENTEACPLFMTRLTDRRSDLSGHRIWVDHTHYQPFWKNMKNKLNNIEAKAKLRLLILSFLAGVIRTPQRLTGFDSTIQSAIRGDLHRNLTAFFTKVTRHGPPRSLSSGWVFC